MSIMGNGNGNGLKSRRLCLEIDSDMYKRIRGFENRRGIYDFQKFFSMNNVGEGDSVMLICGKNRIEAYVDSIDEYKNIVDLLSSDGNEILSLECKKDINMFNIAEDKDGGKRVRVYNISFYGL